MHHPAASSAVDDVTDESTSVGAPPRECNRRVLSAPAGLVPKTNDKKNHNTLKYLIYEIVDLKLRNIKFTLK